MRQGITVYRFLTHDRGFPLTSGVIVDRRPDMAANIIDDLAELAEAANHHPGACAYGKIAVLAKDGIFTFQATSKPKLLPAFCGNSTAAAIRCLGGDEDIRMAVHGSALGSYSVSARIEDDAVSQVWTLPPNEIEEHTWRGRDVLLLRTLNDYAIVLGGLPNEISADAARHELLGTVDTGKLAVIDLTQGCPIVEFHNANGRHGAAPQTGMATIALAARSIGWLNDVFASGQIAFRTSSGPRIARLPVIMDAACGGLCFAMPDITVSYAPLFAELAA